MTIETKYSVGDKVTVTIDGVKTRGTISLVRVGAYHDHTAIMYAGKARYTVTIKDKEYLEERDWIEPEEDLLEDAS